VTFSFDIPGKAAPKGSRRSGTRKDGSRYSYESNPAVPVFMRLAKEHLRIAVAEQGHALVPKSQPLELLVTFYVERPKNPTYSYPPMGDIDKLVRVLLDSAEGIVFENDTQVVSIDALKTYADVSSTVGFVRPAV
jgi:Holliday junction resolvase RusA-like endonuclease